MVFHCSHPNVVEARETFGGLFTAGGGDSGHNLNAFLNLNPRAVAAFIATCFSVGDYVTPALYN